MEIKIEEKKSLALIKKQVEVIENQSVTSITSQSQAEQVVVIRKSVKEAQKVIKEKKEAITKPLNEALKNVRDLFRPFEDRLAIVDTAVSGALLSYERKKAQELAEKEKEVEQKIADGKMTFEKASQVIEKVEAKIDAIPTREITKVRILDKSKLPLEYLIPDEVAIKKALIAGEVVQGAELYKEKIIVNY